MNNITAIFLKQMKETLKNKTVLIQFLMFPAMALIMENAIKIENMPEHFFTKLFAVMFIGMAPLTCMSSIIAEEKEKNTLRALMMSNVRPAEYLTGVGVYILLFCLAGSAVFAVCGGYSGGNFAVFMAVMAAGILLSMFVGAVIGIGSKSQMAATSVTMPVMMVFSFLPMLAMFNDTIEKIAKITYSEQINILINNIGEASGSAESVIVIAVNFVIAAAAFFVIYKKTGLE